jgi:diguanylate cyclase (GGDEF)-like protein
VQVILPDRRGQFWISSNRGFFRVARAELDRVAAGDLARAHSVGYGPGDALRSTTFAGGLQPAGAVDASGRIWLASLKGAVIVDPLRLPDGGKAPAVRVEEIAVDGRFTPPPDPAQGELLLPAGGSAPLTLRYAADTVLNAERVRFRFLMEGLSPNWIDAGKSREARFPALPPGQYRFRVAASLDGQEWQESKSPLVIRVPALPHQNPWFRAAALLLLLALAYGAYRWRTRQLIYRQVQMERLVAEKTEALRQANEHLSQLSFSDALTGLANRRRLDEMLDTEWRRTLRQQIPLAVVVADIDAFKAYNDSLGHTAGDVCLVAVAEVVRQSASRASDLAARYGGEEFVLLLPGMEQVQALAYAERLRAACEARAIPHPASPVAAVVTLSVGVAAWLPTADSTPAALFAAADAALYRAKQEGRNRVRA